MTTADSEGSAKPGDAGLDAKSSGPPAGGGSTQGLLANSAVMAAGTMISRVTGILRDIALTAALGLTIVRDTFNLGNTLPNAIYILVIGGALNAVFIPQLVRKMKQDTDGGKAYADSLLTLSSGSLLVLSTLAVVFAPVIVAVYATTSYTDDQVSLAVAFARFCLPQIFFYGVYTMVSQVLNARGVFGPPMFAPIANNIVAIATYVSFIWFAGTAAAQTGTLTGAQTAWLGLGTTLGVAVQALVLLPLLSKHGYRYSFSTRWRGLGLGKAARLAGWTIGLVLVNQLALIVITRMATAANVSALAAGEAPAGLATYQTSYLIFQLPHGVITVSIVTALLPGLSRLVSDRRLREAGSQLGGSIRTILLLVAPISLTLILTAVPLASVLFGYGAAQGEEVRQLGVATAVFALGVVPFSVFYVLLRGWYAFEDTRTPFFMSLVVQFFHVGIASALFFNVTPGAMQIYALCLAYAAAHWIVVLVAWPILRRRYGGLETGKSLWSLARVLVATGLAWAATWVLGMIIPDYEVGESKAAALATIVMTSGIVLVVYLAVAWLLRLEELRQIGNLVAGRLGRGR